jgi:hypothetical protein
VAHIAAVLALDAGVRLAERLLHDHLGHCEHLLERLLGHLLEGLLDEVRSRHHVLVR